MAIDYAGMLYGPIYDSEGVDAAITLADTGGTQIPLRALYQPSGAEVGGDRINVGTVKNSAAILLPELTEAGYAADDLKDAEITFTFDDGSTEAWAIKSWVPAPSPNGEANGELRLILTKPRA